MKLHHLLIAVGTFITLFSLYKIRQQMMSAAAMQNDPGMVYQGRLRYRWVN